MRKRGVMNDAIKAQISAFVDGELPENEAEMLLRRMSQDRELRQQAAEYLAMGRAIRSERTFAGMDTLRERIRPYLDRPTKNLSPVEHALLLMAACELTTQRETPYRVVINEAVELAKSYGGTDGHKYVNGVLDKLAAELRPDEIGVRKKKV